MAARMSQEVRADPNLTPMLDMVFQLVTFFVMVMTFKSAEIDFNLSLPVVGSARPVKTEGRTGVLVLNIDSAGNLRTTQPIRDLDSFVRIQSQATLLANHMTPADLEGGGEAADDCRDPRRPRHAVRQAQPRDQGLPAERFSQVRHEGPGKRARCRSEGNVKPHKSKR